MTNRIELKNKQSGAVAVHQVNGSKEDAQAWVDANNSAENNDLEARLLGENEEPSKPDEKQKREELDDKTRESLQKAAAGGDKAAQERLDKAAPAKIDDKQRADLERRAAAGDANAKSVLASEAQNKQAKGVVERAGEKQPSQPTGPLEIDQSGRNVTPEGPGAPPHDVVEGQRPVEQGRVEVADARESESGASHAHKTHGKRSDR